MPDDETKQDENEFEGADEETTEESSSKKPFPKKMILIGGGVVVFLIVCVVAYLAFASSIQASDDPDGTAIEQDDGDGRNSRSSRSSKRGGSEKKPSTDIYFTDLDASVVNLGNSEKYDYIYLKYSVNLELGDEGVRVEISQKLPKLISVIDGVVINQQWDKISNPRGRESLANDITDAINEHLTTGEVVACHFVTFVAQ